MHQSYGTPVAPLGLGEIGLPMFYTPIAPLGLCKSGKMPDLRVLGSALIDWDFQPVGVRFPNPSRARGPRPYDWLRWFRLN